MSPMTVCTKNETKRQAPCTGFKTNGEPAILVVEDDGMIRRFICALLLHTTTAFVVEAADPDTALTMVRRMNRPIDLLVSDVNLCASMNGIDLARELSLTNPSMKVLLMSGTDYPEPEIPATWRFMEKPFPIQHFLDCVNALCHSVSTPAAYFG